MAQAVFNHVKKQFPAAAAYQAISWGTGIGDRVNPKVIEPMKELGIDLTKSEYFPKDINHPSIKDKLPNVVKVFTMGCIENGCDLPQGMQVKSEDVVDWGLDDPAKEGVDVLEVRDKIMTNCRELISTFK